MSFLYWNMNYHIDHHMYAGVPFYNLPKLHEAIARDLPESLPSFFGGIRHVWRVYKKQRLDRSYRYQQIFPETAHPPVFA